MKKKQDQYGNLVRILLIAFFFGLMLLGFYLSYERGTNPSHYEIRGEVDSPNHLEKTP